MPGMDTVFHIAGVAGIWGPWEHFYGINTLGTRKRAERLPAARRLAVRFTQAAQRDVRRRRSVRRRRIGALFRALAVPLSAHQGARRAGKCWPPTAAMDLLTCALAAALDLGTARSSLDPAADRPAPAAAELRRVGDGTNLIDMIYVENAASAHLQAADALEPGSPGRGQAYFLSQGEPVNCWEWIDEMLALRGLPPVSASRSRPRAAWTIGAALEGVYCCGKTQRTPHDPFSRRPTWHVALLQHRPSPARLRLRAEHLHRRRHAAVESRPSLIGPRHINAPYFAGGSFENYCKSAVLSACKRATNAGAAI